jgi:hypothetical protein
MFVSPKFALPKGTVDKIRKSEYSVNCFFYGGSMTKKITPTRIIDAVGGTAKAARLSHSAMSTVSDWKHMEEIPPYKLVLLAYPAEVATKGRVGRKKLFPTLWSQIWPELENVK